VILYPTVDEVIATHARLIAKFGGSQGMRDRGALESALARPQSGYYADIIQEAAALRESLSQNHPYCGRQQARCRDCDSGIPPGKRISAGVDDGEAFSFLIRLYETRTLNISQIENWLRKPIVRSDK
jgi:death-on-curing protein